MFARSNRQNSRKPVCGGSKKPWLCSLRRSKQMLDLNFVRENLDAVGTALSNRNFTADGLDRLAELDAERRRVINEADGINQQRNAASKEIGALMQAGKKEEAEAKKAEVAGLKDKQAEL